MKMNYRGIFATFRKAFFGTAVASLCLLAAVSCEKQPDSSVETDSGSTGTDIAEEVALNEHKEVLTVDGEIVEIRVPEWTDIGLTDFLSGDNEEVALEYSFADTIAKFPDFQSDDRFCVTSSGDVNNGDVKMDRYGITARNDVWNAIGFSTRLTDSYTAEAKLYNRESVDSATSSVMFGARVQAPSQLFIDSGLWVSVNNEAAYLILYDEFTVSLGDSLGFRAQDGVEVRFEDDGETIRIYADDQYLASVVVDGDKNSVEVYNAAGESIATGSAEKIAWGDSLGLGYVRVMQHYADSSLAEMSLYSGVQSYTPTDRVVELRDGLSYLLAENVQYKCRQPIAFAGETVLLDAQTVANLWGFDYAEEENSAILSRDDATLTFTVGAASADFNGVSCAFPTTIRRDDAILISADYVARWLGYAVELRDDSLYISVDSDRLTEEKVKELNNRYRQYQAVIYNYDSVAAERTGVGLYEKTPYEDRLVGIAYTTWHSESYSKWGLDTWDVPLYGGYASNDEDIIYRHGVMLRDAGVDFIFVDWSNNTNYDPETMSDSRPDFRMVEGATSLLFEIWSTIEGAPKICIMAGPGGDGIENVTNGNHQKKVDQIYRDYVEKYPDQYFYYEGQPLLICYGSTPNEYSDHPSSVWDDERFTVRWITGYVGQQPSLFDKETMRSTGFWSWEERGTQTYTVIDGRVECITVTAASRAQGERGEAGYVPGNDRENGVTLKRQFQRANDLGAGVVLLVSWNEWLSLEQKSPEGSKDLEPSQIHGTFYYDLLCEQIRKYKGQLNVGAGK